MAAVDPALPRQPAARIEFNEASALEKFCQEYFHLSAETAYTEWLYDSDALISRAVHYKGEPRSALEEAVQQLSPFKRKSHFGVFPPMLIEFPLHAFFHPCAEFNVSKWKESQQIFRRLAMAFFDFRRLSEVVTGEKFAEALAKEALFATTGLLPKYKEPFYFLVKSFFDFALKESLEELSIERLRHLPATYRIYTLSNIMVALYEPQKIFDRLSPANQKGVSLNEIKAYARFFFNVSIKLHLDSLLMRSKESTEQLPLQSLKILCVHAEFFLQYALAAMQKETTDFHLPEDSSFNYLSHAFVNGKYQTAPVACTLLQALLTMCGFDASVHMRLDIPPIKTECYCHTIVVVTHPLTRKRILVDPTYMPYITLPEGLSIFICPEEQLEQEIKRHSPYDGHGLLKKIWNLSGYVPVMQNSVADSILNMSDETREPALVAVKGIIKKVGLEGELVRPSSRETKQKLLKSCSKMSKTALLEELRALDDESQQAFIPSLGLDPRPLTKVVFLPVKVAGYAMALQEAINPSKRCDTTTLYGCGGADVSMALLTTASRRLFMIDQTPVQFDRLKSALTMSVKDLSDEEIIKHYRRGKWMFGGGESDVFEMPSIEMKIALELYTLGVNLKDVSIEQLPSYDGCCTLSFPWGYHGRETEKYEITWICANLTNPIKYPAALKKLLKLQAFDYYYQKAAMNAPRSYSTFLPVISKGLKPGGYLLMNNHDHSGKSHDPSPYLSDPYQTMEDTPLMKAYQQLFKGELDTAYAAEPSPHVPNDEKYWLLTTIMKKIST